MSVNDMRLITPKSAPSEHPYDDLAAWLLQTEPRRHDAWALVDDLSCALTLVIPEDNARLTWLQSPAEDTTQRVLTRLVERFMGHKIVSAPGLLRRPALQLVLCAANGALTETALKQAVHKVELLHRRLETRVGLDLPDFKLTFCERPLATPTNDVTLALASLPDMAQAFHLRFLNNTNNMASLRVRLEAVTDKVNDVRKRLVACDEAIREALPPDATDRVEALVAQINTLELLPKGIDPELTTHDLAEKTADTTADAAKVPPTPFSLTVAARHWARAGEARPEHAARLPLGALSLVVADNAAGKTSAAETFSLLTADLPRARPLAPRGSERLDGDVTLDAIGPPDALTWDNTTMLPIFSDDTGLTEGTPGALSVATLWPTVAATPTLKALGELAWAARSFRQWSAERPEDDPVAEGDWDTLMTTSLHDLKLLAECVEGLFEELGPDAALAGLSTEQSDALIEWALAARRAPEPPQEREKNQSAPLPAKQALTDEEIKLRALADELSQALSERPTLADDEKSPLSEALRVWLSTIPSAAARPRPADPDVAEETPAEETPANEEPPWRLAQHLREALSARNLGDDPLELGDPLWDRLHAPALRWAKEMARLGGPAVAPPPDALKVIWPGVAAALLAKLQHELNTQRVRAVLAVEAHLAPEAKDRLIARLHDLRADRYDKALVELGAWEARADRAFEWALGIDSTLHTALKEMTERIDQLLSHDVYIDPARRRNTAEQVRLGLAARLARALLLSPHGLPMLTLDEPTLGQHRVSSARAIARVTRLARFIEGERWTRAENVARVMLPGPPELLPLAVGSVSLSQPVGAENTQRPAPRLSALAATARLDLRPPMLLIFSYQDQALTHLAQLEGEALTHGLRESLQRLIAPWWRVALRAAVHDLDEDWLRVTARWLADAPRPSLVLQQVEAKLPSLPSTSLTERELEWWRKEAQKGLEELGLKPLGRALALPKSEEDEKKEREKEPHEPINPEEGKDQAKALSERWRFRVVRASRELIRWLALVEMLPAVMDDVAFDLHTSGVELRRLSPEGGEAQRIGALRVRRVSPVMLTRVWRHEEDGQAHDAPQRTTPATQDSEDTAPTTVADETRTAQTTDDNEDVERGEVYAPEGDVPQADAQEVRRDASPASAITSDHPTTQTSTPATDAAPATAQELTRSGEAHRPQTGAALLTALVTFGTLLADESPSSPPPQTPPQPTPPDPQAQLAPRPAPQPPPLSARAKLLKELISAPPASRAGEYWIQLNDQRFTVERPPQDFVLLGEDRALTPAQLAFALPIVARAADVRGAKRLVLTLDCTPPVALAAGFTLNALPGRAVEVMAGFPNQALERFVLHEPTPSARILVPKKRPEKALPRGAELHVLATLTPKATREPYDHWREALPAADGPAPGLLWLDGVELVPDGAQAAWLARVLHRIILNHRPERAALRLFLALPNVVSFALGQRLVNLGEVKLMELARDSAGPPPTFTYREWGTLKT